MWLPCLHPRVLFQQVYSPSCEGPSWLIRARPERDRTESRAWSSSQTLESHLCVSIGVGRDPGPLARKLPSALAPFHPAVLSHPLFLLPGVPTPLL